MKGHWEAWILLGYLSGSVLYGYLLPKWIYGRDVTALSKDRNPGGANAFLYGGHIVGITAILLDVLKGFLPVFGAAGSLDVSNPWFGLVILAPVAGHAWPFWKKGGGGKAIAVSFGVLLALYPDVRPAATLAFLYIFFSVAVVIRPHFFRSLAVYGLLAAEALFRFNSPAVVIGTAGVCLVVIIKHISRYQGERLRICLGSRDNRREAF